MDRRDKAAVIPIIPCSTRMKILILTSNPRTDLNLNEEIRDLQSVIERSRHREQFKIEVGLAVRPKDLQGLLLKYEPQIVHFCGHGTGEQGLVLQDESGREQFVSTDALKNLFELFAERVECVLLNACYSEMQANVIVEHINYVIGMSQEILDTAAIAFATGFYGALGYGRSVEESYKFGCNQIHLTVSDASNAARRSVISEEQRKLEVVSVVGQAVERVNIPEFRKPQLKQKSKLTVVANPVGGISPQSLSSNEKVDLQLTIDRAYDSEIKLKQYRDRVREFLSDRKLSTLETIRLERLRKDLGLSEPEANRILTEEQEPIRKAQDEYEAVLIGLIKAGHYPPWDAATQAELLGVQQELGLSDEEVAVIAPPILAAAEEDYQQKLERQRVLELEQQQRELASEKGINYTKLRDLLQANKWKDADRETSWRMLEAVGRKGSDWIREKELQNFPCADLLTIDRLWAKYSNGHFGFSVQKKIWQECGSPISGEDWDRFCFKVGWKTSAPGSYADHDYVHHYTFEFDPKKSPVGELPGVGLNGLWGGMSICGGWVDLFSRTAACEA